MPREVSFVLPLEQEPRSLREGELRFAAARALGEPPKDFGAVRLLRYSLDARPGHEGWRVTVLLYGQEETPPPVPATEPPRIPPPPPAAPRVAVVGSGPAGLFAALELLRGGLHVVLLERGRQVQPRRRDLAALNRGADPDPDSNYCHGEGGAGTYSDGKLYTRSVPREEARAILEEFVRHGAPEDILHSWRPHIGSNRLPQVVEALRRTLQDAGAELRFEARVEALLTDRGRVRGVRLAGGEELEAEAVVLAAGHSAADSLRMAEAAGAVLVPKGFAMGVRIEHPQPWLDALQYRGARLTCPLPPAFYELRAQSGERGVYSFCMCPGGWIVPCATRPGQVVVNGMSLSRRDSPWANSGLVVELRPEDWCGRRGGRFGWPALLREAAALDGDPLLHGETRAGKVADGRLPESPEEDPWFGARVQLALEVVAAHAGGGAGRVPGQRADLFAAGRGEAGEARPTSYRPGVTAVDLDAVLPPGIARRLREALVRFDRRLPGFAGPEGQLHGVESRTSSPVRILRDRRSGEAEGLRGLYPAGEGAGYAGGIVSAAADGRRAARGILLSQGQSAGRNRR